MGIDKAFVKYGNRNLYEYSLSVLSFFSGDILISSSNPVLDNLNYRRIEDEMPNLGPLGGIYSCLKNIRLSSAIVLPCDLPLITIDIIQTLLKNSQGYEITVALNHQGQPEPLIGIYSAAVLLVMEKMIQSKQYKMQEILKVAKTNFVKIPGLPPATFMNVNNPDELLSLPPIIPGK